MCTLTAFQAGKKFIITMNRDENINRPEGALVKTSQLLFPSDLPSSGTWFGVNQQATVMTLLNRYHDVNPALAESTKKKSRGLIIPAALAHATTQQIIAYIRALDFVNYEPFDLLIFSHKKSMQFSWNGKLVKEYLIEPQKGLMITSSSVSTQAVIEHREKLFNSWMQQQTFSNNKTLAENTIKQFHLIQDKSNPSWSVFMDRQHTHTKSICQLLVNDDDVQLAYYNQQKLAQIRQGLAFESVVAEKATLIC